MNLDESLSKRLNVGLRLDTSNRRDVTRNKNINKIDDVSLNLDNDVVDWSDEGEDDDDTPRNHDILSRLAEESEDDCDQDVLQFSRFLYYCS